VRDSRGCGWNHTGSVRLFVAVDVNDAVRGLAQKAAAALANAGVTGRFELSEKLHVTLAFLGSVGDELLDDIVQILRNNEKQTPFWIDFDRIGAYPNLHRPHVIWIGSSRPNSQFASCAAQLRAGLTNLGFRFDHEATPHVTICRPKHARHFVLPQLASNARLHVEGLTLYQSLPAGQTTRYEAIDRTSFEG
jgi:RNA 2',3'-cyclic 3'-phosphodiesterase